MNYMGSKSRIAKYIVPIIQSYIDNNNITTYIEPFVGGMNVIDKIHCKCKIGSDLSPYLIALHTYAQKNGQFPNEITREEYNKVRESYNKNTNEYTDTIKGIYGYLSSMNGRFFDGGFAKPSYGRNYYREKRDNLIKQRQNDEYKNVFLNCCDYTYYEDIKITNAVIYCDPPYKNTTHYNCDKNFDHDAFWNWVRVMSKDNIVIVSEQEAPSDFKCIWSKPIKSTIRTTANVEGKILTEKLFIKN